MANLALRKIILRELSLYKAPITVGGIVQLARLSMPATSLGDVRDELGALHDAGHVAYVEHPDAPRDADLRQWTITQTGELHLKK